MTFYWIQNHYISILVFGLVSFVLLSILERVTGKRWLWVVCAVLVSIVYVLALYTVTLKERIPDGNYHYNLTLFWSYREIIKNHDTFLLQENIQNVAVFIPLGVLLCESFKYRIKWYQAVLTGAAISLVIELTQLLTTMGLFEFDDIFHNTLGTMLGFFFARAVQKVLGVTCAD